LIQVNNIHIVKQSPRGSLCVLDHKATAAAAAGDEGAAAAAAVTSGSDFHRD
jgi:hypothetical protein